MTNLYRSWVVDTESSGLRLDVFLQKMGAERSRSEWSRLIEEGCVFINLKKITQRSHRLVVLDEVMFDQQQIEPVAKTVTSNFNYVAPEILFEDESLMVINKPEGLPVHAGNGIPFEKTLAHWVLSKKYLSKDDEWPEEVVQDSRWGIVHRLDLCTSGAMVIAKNAKVHRDLSLAFQNRLIHRRYFAVTGGSPSNLSNKIPALLDKWCHERKAAFKMTGNKFSLATQYGRDPTHPLRMSPIFEGGKRAITHAYIHSEATPHAIIELKLQTGRTHQIRSHLRFLGYSIVGDTLYGGQKWHRVLLHSHTIRFVHPVTGATIEANAPSPSFLEACLQLGLRVPSNTDDLWQET
ncbi:MAG: RluA family pseudouridine synthase [Bdellovibrionota bacterium]